MNKETEKKAETDSVTQLTGPGTTMNASKTCQHRLFSNPMRTIASLENQSVLSMLMFSKVVCTSITLRPRIYAVRGFRIPEYLISCN